MAIASLGIVFVLLQVLGLLIETRGDVYVVLMVDDPVVSYQGSIPEFPATAAPSGAKVDVTREHVQSYKKYLSESHDMLLQRTLESGTYTKLYSYHHLINGFAVDASAEAIERLAVAEEVKHIEKNWKVQKMTTHTPHILGLPNQVWPQLGGPEHAGEGVVIGLVDSGINPRHPSFSNSQATPRNFKGKCEVGQGFPAGSCNNKIVAARHFAAAAIAEGTFNATLDYASPYDVEGHGSHTASTAAGNYRVPVIVNGFNYGYATGMAPRAKIAMYRAMFTLGGYMADLIAAIDKAVEDGVDILNLSLGPSSIPPGVSTFLSTLDIELLYAAKAGVFVVQAAGNSGPKTGTMLSFSPWTTTVAASVTDRSYVNTIELGNGQTYAGIGLAPPTEGELYHKMVSAVDVSYKNTTYEASVSFCQTPEPFIKHLVQGNILMCSYTLDFAYGSSTIRAVADTAQKLGAAGFLMTLDPVEIGSDEDIIKDGSVPLTVPGIIVTDYNHTVALMEYYNASTKRDIHGTAMDFGATARINDGRVATYSRSGPAVTQYSSRGPDVNNANSQPSDTLKPNIMAPGDQIWAAWSPTSIDVSALKGQNFAMMSGTSMATPHVAGVAALIKQKYPSWSPAAITSALMTTAYVMDKYEKPILAQNPENNSTASLGPATPFDCGAGAINPAKALDPGLIFYIDFDNYIGFLCSVPGVDEGSVRVATGVGCPSNIPWSSDLNTPSITVSNLIGSMHVHRVMKNVADTETYNAVIREPEGVEVKVWPESFTIPKDNSTSLTVILRVRKAEFDFTFGDIVLKGDKGHDVRIPLAVHAASALGN
eukprot:Gb_39302 [translate_table: standard]